MADIHIKEIMNYLSKKGFKDAIPCQTNREGFFLSIDFFDPESVKDGIVDEEFANRVITVDCPYGSVTILFDEEGLLHSLEIC